MFLLIVFDCKRYTVSANIVQNYIYFVQLFPLGARNALQLTVYSCLSLARG